VDVRQHLGLDVARLVEVPLDEALAPAEGGDRLADRTVEELGQLLGGGQRRQEYQDFVRRYDDGPPWAGVSDQEAAQRYQQVASRLSPQEYQQSAQEAFSRLSPQERQQFGEYLRQQAQQQGVNIPDLNRDGIDDRLQDSAYLAQVTSRMHQQQPGLLGQLLGGAAGGSPGGAPNRAILEARKEKIKTRERAKTRRKEKLS